VVPWVPPDLHDQHRDGSIEIGSCRHSPRFTLRLVRTCTPSGGTRSH
jgi:hypothetical protein